MGVDDKPNACKASFVSKKQTTIGVRVDDELLATILQLADDEDRTPAAVVRLLAIEALTARGLKPQKMAAKKRAR